MIVQLSEEQIQEIDKENRHQYRYYQDTRSKHEIELTNLLARSLSELNFQSLKKQLRRSSTKTLRKEDILYVCLPGVPPMQDEFKFLELPGQQLFFRFVCFEKGHTEQELLNMPTEFDQQAKLLHRRINQTSVSKPIVFVFHSFGSYILASYCHLFKNQRIIGIIDAGGAPIQFYPGMKELVRNQRRVPPEYIRQNLDEAYQYFLERSKRFRTTPYQNKYQVLGVNRAIQQGRAFKQMFVKLRSLPNVLKCYIYGRKDIIFLQDLINQKVIYYSYQNKFDPQYQQKLQREYQKCLGKKTENIQSKFIFSFEEGYHSIHAQKKFKEYVKSIAHRYLDFIQEMYSNQSKL